VRVGVCVRAYVWHVRTCALARIQGMETPQTHSKREGWVGGWVGEWGDADEERDHATMCFDVCGKFLKKNNI
jgi:hypothetical protein